MSLKSFHIFFISVVFLLGLGLGAWAYRAQGQNDPAGSISLAVGAWVGSLCIAVYGVWFLRKIRGVKLI